MVVKKNLFIFFLISMLPAFVKCGQAQEHDKDKQYPSPPGYQLNNPYVINLKTELDEISGVSFYPKDTSVFAISDDKGSLYKIYVKYKSRVEKWKFAKANDFEDLVLADSIFYVLASDGSINTFKYDSEKPSVSTYETALEGDNEFETLYKDEATKKLVMICKDCEADTKGTVTAYSFDPSTQTFSDDPFFVIDATQITAKLPKEKGKFKPSAACINPVTHELYIISSVNKALVVADTKGNVKEVYPLNPSLYKQPEGLTFTPSGDLIISNEQAEIGSANILIFKYKSAVK
jgi:uncharacterized protein YjiK